MQYTASSVTATLGTVAPERLDALRAHLQAQGWRTEFSAPVLTARPSVDGPPAAGTRQITPTTGQP